MKIYSGSNSLKLVSFTFEKGRSAPSKPPIQVIRDIEEINNTLNGLSEYLEKEMYGHVFLKRIMKIYEENKVFVIKSNESRYWTEIEAYRDADETLADILCTWRQKQLGSSGKMPV